MREYSKRLGVIADEQFQASLARFDLGEFVSAAPIPFGHFGQNVFITSTKGEYVLRGTPHFPWQFPTEQFYTNLLHERTHVPVPWPYLIDPASDIFGWSYVLMPRLPGLQLADQAVREQLDQEDKGAIARALGENLARMHELTWPFSGRYDAMSESVKPFDLQRELAWPFPLSGEENAAAGPTTVSYSELVQARIRRSLALARELGSDTTAADSAWVEEMLTQAQGGLDDAFQPCLVMNDYKRDNLVVTCTDGAWSVSGVFDLMQTCFGDGEADLSRAVAMYLEEGSSLAREFVQAYVRSKPPRPGIEQRFVVYMLDERLILWIFFHRHNQRWWDAGWTFRDWASRYIVPDSVF